MAAAPVIAALVAAVFEELVEQVTVGPVQLHPVKPALPRMARGLGIVGHDARQLLRLEGTRGRGGGKAACARGGIDQIGFGLGRQGRGGHGCGPARLQAGVRHAAHMPELGEDFAALGMHGLGRLSSNPAAARAVVQAWHVGIALALLADGRGLR